MSLGACVVHWFPQDPPLGEMVKKRKSEKNERRKVRAYSWKTETKRWRWVMQIADTEMGIGVIERSRFGQMRSAQDMSFTVLSMLPSRSFDNARCNIYSLRSFRLSVFPDCYFLHHLSWRSAMFGG